MNSDILLNKIPPQNIEAEESLITAMLINNDYISDVLDTISSEAFYKIQHQKIFSAIEKLFTNKINVDLITLTDQLVRDNEISVCGGASGISKLISNCPMSTNPLETAKIINEKYILRQLISKSTNIISRCFSQVESVEEIIDSAQKEIMGVEISDTSDSFTTMAALTDQSVDRYQENAENYKNGINMGIRMGFREFDKITGGFKGSQYIIIAGRPGMGKTALALTIARNIAKQQHTVGILSIEMDKEQLDDRLFSIESGVNSMKLSNGEGPNNEEWQSIMAAARRKSMWPIIIDDTGGITIDTVKRKCRIMKKKFGCKIIIIDQLSKIKGQKNKDRFTVIAENSNEIQFLVKELRIPIILLAQLNRKLEDRSNKEPVLSDLKMTGNLEEDADLIFLLYRPEIYNPNDPTLEGRAVINLAKHRNGATWRSENIEFVKKLTLFRDKEVRYGF
jgi:replicative DNA helicase